jgi:hypothetical protein
MKTLKFLIALCIVACFSGGTGNAQVQRLDGTYSLHVQSEYGWTCNGELVTGDIECTYTVMYKEGSIWFHEQDSFTGTLIGDISGDIYTMTRGSNDHQVNISNNNGGGTSNWSYVTTCHIEKDGKLVGTLHFIQHGTCNTATWDKKDGNWASYVDKGWIECK